MVRRKLYTPTAGPPNHLSKARAAKVKKKNIKFTNFLITAHIMVGGNDAQRHTLFCGILFMKEQFSNQERAFLILIQNRGTYDLVTPPASATLNGSISITILGMKVSYMKLLPCITLNIR